MFGPTGISECTVIIWDLAGNSLGQMAAILADHFPEYNRDQWLEGLEGKRILRWSSDVHTRYELDRRLKALRRFCGAFGMWNYIVEVKR